MEFEKPPGGYRFKTEAFIYNKSTHFGKKVGFPLWWGLTPLKNKGNINCRDELKGIFFLSSSGDGKLNGPKIQNEKTRFGLFFFKDLFWPLKTFSQVSW